MVLFINGKKTDFKKADLNKLMKLTLVFEAAKKIHDISKVIINVDRHTLYLNQSEMVEVGYKDSAVKFIGTDDLTTCQFIVLNSQETETVICAHLDGSATEAFLEESVKILFRKLRNNINQACHEDVEINVSVLLLGGFCDDSDYSESITTNLIKHLSESYDLVNFNLDLLCACTLNNKTDNDFNYPIHQGAVYDIENKILLPAKFSIAARGPLFILRNTRFNADPNIYKIYNSIDECLEIFPFDYKAKDRQKYYKSLSKSSDFMLRRFSTSPRQEQLGFESVMRQVFTLMSDHPDPIQTIFNSHHRPIRYKCDRNSGEWKEI